MPSSEALFIVSTDSYLKWAAALQSQLSNEWKSDLILVRSLQGPSKRQRKVALKGFKKTKLKSMHLVAAVRKTIKLQPAFVFVGGTGPFLSLFRWALNFSSKGRHIKIVSGSPGIGFHLTGDPLKVRSYADLVIVASKRERSLFQNAISGYNFPTRIALSRLSFLTQLENLESEAGPISIVFAPQPDMPATLDERKLVLEGLLKLRQRFPEVNLVVKLRAINNEPQTHFEKYGYQGIFAMLVNAGLAKNGDLKFEVGAMADFLKNRNSTLMTVSSTAALEALALARPVHIISDFGLSDELANKVFIDSGLTRDIAMYDPTVVNAPTANWVEDNYFHDSSEDTLIDELISLTSTDINHNFEILPKRIGKSLFIGEFLRVMLPNKFGATLIRVLKRLSNKSAD